MVFIVIIGHFPTNVFQIYVWSSMYLLKIFGQANYIRIAKATFTLRTPFNIDYFRLCRSLMIMTIPISWIARTEFTPNIKTFGICDRKSDHKIVDCDCVQLCHWNVKGEFVCFCTQILWCQNWQGRLFIMWWKKFTDTE